MTLLLTLLLSLTGLGVALSQALNTFKTALLSRFPAKEKSALPTAPTPPQSPTLTPEAGFWRPLPHSSRSPYLLVGLFALFPLVLIALPSTPIFGGTRTWMPAMPFVALLAGLGLSRLVATFNRTVIRKPRTQNIVATAALCIAVLPGLCQTIHAADLAPSYYTPIIGGTHGGADLGMKRQYWGYSNRQLLSYLNRTIARPTQKRQLVSSDSRSRTRSRYRRRSRLYWHDTIYYARDLYVRDHLLSPQILSSGGEYFGIRSSQNALFQYEKHQVMWEFTIWQEYNTFKPTTVLTLDGVPLLNFYGPKFRPHSPNHPPARRGEKNKAHLVVGPRQAGKSTVVWQWLSKRKQKVLFIDCEQPLIQRWCSSAPLFAADVRESFSSPPILFFEEVQHLDDGALFFKGLVDRRPGVPVLVTGSSAYYLRSGSRESLAGRATRTKLLPFSWQEIATVLESVAPLARIRNRKISPLRMNQLE